MLKVNLAHRCHIFFLSLFFCNTQHTVHTLFIKRVARFFSFNKCGRVGTSLQFWKDQGLLQLGQCVWLVRANYVDSSLYKLKKIRFLVFHRMR